MLFPAYQNPAVVTRVSHEAQIDRADAQARFAECLKFLDLCAAHPGVAFVPSATVDEAWHQFVLHTEDYHAYCQQTAGAYIHHSPSDEPETEGYARTLTFMTERFGKLDARLWPANDAGSCNGKCSGKCKSNPIA